MRDAAERLPWVEKAAVRLRESGHVIAGEVFVVPRAEDNLVANVEAASEALCGLDWRIYSLTVMPVSRLDGTDVPRH
jgi:hypothetical protein